MIYFDNNATTPLLPEVRASMAPFLDEQFGNPSSVHGLGCRARAALDQARKEIAAGLKVLSSELIFTGGGSEANNLAIVGVLAHLFRTGQHKGKNLVISAIEHPAVTQTAAWAANLFGFELRVAEIQVLDGQILPDPFFRLIDSKTALVSVMAAHNETGVLLPIQAIFNRARAKGALCHCDAVQALGKMAVIPQALGADLLTLSAHKAHGPKGVGALYVRRGVKLEPLVHGGSQEMAHRAGTENVAAIVGFQTAFKLAQAADTAKLLALRDDFELRLVESYGDSVQINFQGLARSVNTSSVQFRKQDGNLLLIKLDRAGVCISTGSACASGSLSPSKSLLNMGLGEREAQASLRFSFSRLNTHDEVTECLNLLKDIFRPKA